MDGTMRVGTSKGKGVLRARHRWIAARVREALGMGSAGEVESALSTPRNFALLQDFLGHTGFAGQGSSAASRRSAATPTAIYVLYQPEPGRDDETQLLPRITVSTGDSGEGLVGQAVYFWRTDAAQATQRCADHGTMREVSQEESARDTSRPGGDGEASSVGSRSADSVGSAGPAAGGRGGAVDLALAVARGLPAEQAVGVDGSGLPPHMTPGSLTDTVTSLPALPQPGPGDVLEPLDAVRSLPPLDLMVAADGKVAFGTVHPDLLLTMDSMLGRVVSPLLRDLALSHSKRVEGVTKHLAHPAPPSRAMAPQDDPVAVSMSCMLDAYKSAISSARGATVSGSQLRVPNERWTSVLLSFANAEPEDREGILGPGVVKHAADTVESWIGHVEQFLEDVGEAGQRGATTGTPPPLPATSTTDKLPGPDTEVKMWRARSQQLHALTEQLKRRIMRVTVAVLTSAARSGRDFGPFALHSRCAALLTRWRATQASISAAAVEAKDNVKYLNTLEKSLAPLYVADPDTVRRGLPGLLNACSMVYQISRHFNSTERMTNLLMKVTNQLIRSCSNSVLRAARANPVEVDNLDLVAHSRAAPGRRVGGRSAGLLGHLPALPGASSGTKRQAEASSVHPLWHAEPSVALLALESVLTLSEEYQHEYRVVRAELAENPQGRQWDFSEAQIFGQFDLFCRRIVKLLDVFSTVHQFRLLATHRVHGMGKLIRAFFSVLEDLKAQQHDLLAFDDASFDKAYVVFNVRVADLETSLQFFINQAFDALHSVEASLALLHKLKNVLQRDTLLKDLDSKFRLIFHQYGLDLLNCQELYERQKDRPPLARAMPPVSGAVQWSRHLLDRVRRPMEEFQKYPSVLKGAESKKIIKAYNRLARTLVAFEYLWHSAWVKSVDSARAGLDATLLVRHPADGRLHVNFDSEIAQLMREARCLDRMPDVEVPPPARAILQREAHLKHSYTTVAHVLAEYNRVRYGMVLPVTLPLLRPALTDLDVRMRPALVSLTWTSLNIDTWCKGVLDCIHKLEGLILSVNDIVEHRIEKNIKRVARMDLMYLPREASFTVSSFAEAQAAHLRERLEALTSANTTIEVSVEDAIDHVRAYPVHPRALIAVAGQQLAAEVAAAAKSRGTSEKLAAFLEGRSHEEALEAAQRSLTVDDGMQFFRRAVLSVRQHYSEQMYLAAVAAVRQSLSALKARVCARVGSSGVLLARKPFFRLDVQLAAPSVQLSPPLDSIQSGINAAARNIIHSFKAMPMWGQLPGHTYGEEPTLASPEGWVDTGDGGGALQLSLAALPAAGKSPAPSPEAAPVGGAGGDRSSLVAAILSAPTQQAAALAHNTGSAMVLGQGRSLTDGSRGGSGVGAGGSDSMHSLFELIGRDVQVIKFVLLLAGALHGTSASVRDYLKSFRDFEWLWTADRDAAGAAFFAASPPPTLDAIEGKLRDLAVWEARIPHIQQLHVLGALAFSTTPLKAQLQQELQQWKAMYADAISDRMASRMQSLSTYMASLQGRLEVKAHTLPKLQAVMSALAEVRQRAGAISSEIEPIAGMIRILQRYMPDQYVDQASTDAEVQLRQRWARVVAQGTAISETLQGQQASYHAMLQEELSAFLADVRDMRSAWESDGAMQPQLSPQEALPRMRRCQARFELLSRRQASLRESQALFALPLVNSPELSVTAAELGLCSAVFGLWEEVDADLAGWKATQWAEAIDQLPSWTERIKSHEVRVRRLPRQVKSWAAYRTLRLDVQHMSEVLPLLTALGQEYVRPRHWAALAAVVEEAVNVQTAEFTVEVLMGLGGGLLRHAEAVEDITDAAEKQAGIEAKLNGIRADWAERAFSFSRWGDRTDTWVLSGYGSIVEDLEESSLVLQTQLGLRQVGPFKEALTSTLNQLSEVSDTLELWLKVQSMWAALERVFRGGDIVNQLPSEAKKFARIDTEWARLMAAAHETELVLPAASNDVLRSSLPAMLGELEKCSKSLEGYLEAKRAAYPRFYFVASSTLLQLLSQGSDVSAMQRFYEKLYDAVDRVEVEERPVATVATPALASPSRSSGGGASTPGGGPDTEAHIIAMTNVVAGHKEEVGLVESVTPKGSVEDWLANLEVSMQRTVKSLCRRVASVAMATATGTGGSLREVVSSFPAQIAIVGLQVSWSETVSHTLDNARGAKTLLSDTTKHQLALLSELGTMCLNPDLVHQPMQRIKLETLVVVQVHQRDVWSSLARAYRERRIASADAFEWTRQTRLAWVGNDHEAAQQAQRSAKGNVWDGGMDALYGQNAPRRGKGAGAKRSGGGTHARRGVSGTPHAGLPHPVPLGGVLATAQGSVKAVGASALGRAGAPGTQVSAGADTSMLAGSGEEGEGEKDELGEGRLEVRVADITMGYGYEYLGVKDRLVITPLTDRAYIAFSQALSMHCGASPVGPAGTGKTETVKDMGRTLGLYVVVTNCSSEMRYSDVAKIFRGLCQAGCWGCFDEFNRITLPVLSVVAQQVASITSARRALATQVLFPGDAAPSRLLPGTGYFVTMNPSGKGYGGRSKLPDNLKSQFRSIAMMVPDRTIIIKVKLCALGYGQYDDLATKFQTLYSMLEQQLSPQRHYDFGLRSVLSVLRRAGAQKRSRPHDNEEYLLYDTLQVMNVSKLVEQDIRLFKALLADVFPGVSLREGSRGGVQAAITAAAEGFHLSTPQAWVDKAVQLHGSMLVRHGIALIGPAGAGKSAMVAVLAQALNTDASLVGGESGASIRVSRLNPKAVDTEELYGYTDPHGGGEWVPGVFSNLFERLNAADKHYTSWLVMDGPVDTVWIENLNSVLDDNKVLTLASGDRIRMQEGSRLIMEARDLRNASPATVSRCGILYLPPTALSWEPLLTAWCRHLPAPVARVVLGMAQRFIGGTAASGAVTAHLVRHPEAAKTFVPDASDVPPLSSHEEHLIREAGGTLFFFLSRACAPCLYMSPVAIVSTLCALLVGQLTSAGLAGGSAPPPERDMVSNVQGISLGAFSSFEVVPVQEGAASAFGNVTTATPGGSRDLASLLRRRPPVPVIHEGPLYSAGQSGSVREALVPATSDPSSSTSHGDKAAEFCDDVFQGWGAQTAATELPARLTGLIERMFLFALAWSVGGSLRDADRVKVHRWLRALGAPLPPPTPLPSPRYGSDGAFPVPPPPGQGVDAFTGTFDMAGEADEGYGMTTIYDWIVDASWRGRPGVLLSTRAGDAAGRAPAWGSDGDETDDEEEAAWPGQVGPPTRMRREGWALWVSALPQVSVPLPLLHPPSDATAGATGLRVTGPSSVSSPAQVSSPGGEGVGGPMAHLSVFAKDGDAAAAGLGALAAGGCDALDLSGVTIPTYHIMRAVSLAAALHTVGCPVLIAGSTGTGKVSTATLLLQQLAPDQFATSPVLSGMAQDTADLLVNRACPAGTVQGGGGGESPRVASGRRGAWAPSGHARLAAHGKSARYKRLVLNGVTTCAGFGQALQAGLERRGGRTFGAPSGRNMVVFVEDLGCPAPNTWGDKPALETLRQVMEVGTTPFLERDRRGELKSLEDLHILATARVVLTEGAAAAGGRYGEGADGGTPAGMVPSRLLRHFGCVFMDAPGDYSLDGMFGAIVRSRFNPAAFNVDMLRHWDAPFKAARVQGDGPTQQTLGARASAASPSASPSVTLSGLDDTAALSVQVGASARVGAVLTLLPAGWEQPPLGPPTPTTPSTRRHRRGSSLASTGEDSAPSVLSASPALGWVAGHLVEATRQLQQWCASHLMPTPLKFHYAAFNTNDVSRVMQGVCSVPRHDVRDGVSLLQLWAHECHRVMRDKLTLPGDAEAFDSALHAVALRVFLPEHIHSQPQHRQPPSREACDALAATLSADADRHPTADLMGTHAHSLAVVALGLTVEEEVIMGLACIGAAAPEYDYVGVMQRHLRRAPDSLLPLLLRRLRPGLMACGLDGEAGAGPDPASALPASALTSFSPLLHTLDVHEDGLPISPRRTWYQPVPLALRDEEAEPAALDTALAWLRAGEEEAELLAEWSAAAGRGPLASPGARGDILGQSVDLDASGDFSKAASARRRSSTAPLQPSAPLANPAPPTTGGVLVVRRVAEAALGAILRDTPGSPLKGIVLFQYGTEHLLRIARVLSQPGGHAVLVGVGGSGRCSMTRLAAYMLGMEFRKPVASRAYTRGQWLDDLRKVCRQAGGGSGRGVVLFLTEAAFGDAAWMGDVHTIMCAGMLPGLFNKEELTMVLTELSATGGPEAQAADSTQALTSLFASRVKRNLHVVYGIAPMVAGAAGDGPTGPLDTFASLSMTFPALLSRCVVDFHMPWPTEALVEVAHASVSALPALAPPLQLSRTPAAGARPPPGGWPDVAAQAFDERDLSVGSGAGGTLMGQGVQDGQLTPLAAAAGAALLQHLAQVHADAVAMARAYSNATGRFVTFTPKSYLALLTAFGSLFKRGMADIQEQEARVRGGLAKLAKGAEDVEVMQVQLEGKMTVVAAKQRECAGVLQELQVEAADAERENEVVTSIKAQCEERAAGIAEERDVAEADLAAAKPFLDAAEEAVNKITSSALVELKAMQSPQPIIRIVFDGVLLLMNLPAVRVAPTTYALGATRSAKRQVDFLRDSFPHAKKLLLNDVNFIKRLMSFSADQRDLINDETIELLTPYVELPEFSPDVARNASVAAEGLLLWVRAMVMYHGAAKIVRPKLEALQVATVQLQNAEAELQRATDRLAVCEARVADLKASYDVQMEEKHEIEEDALATRKTMERAQSLLASLAGERARWQQDQRAFRARMGRLPGDCTLIAAFLTYAGPLDAEHRTRFLQATVVPGSVTRFLPVTLVSGSGDATVGGATLPRLTDMLGSVLSDLGTMGDWKLKGLPSDDLSMQNALLVMTGPHHGKRYPLLIDPQGQAVEWVRRTTAAQREATSRRIAAHVAELREREASSLVAAAVEGAGTSKYFVPLGAEGVKVHTPRTPRLRECMEMALREGWTVLLKDIGSEAPGLLQPLLNRAFVTRGSRVEVKLGGSEVPVEVHPDFALFLATVSGNPAFSPDLQASCTLVDFTVTQGGLEEQLLGRVIRAEEAELEEQLQGVLTSLTDNTKAMSQLDDALLARLAESEHANLLEDDELMGVLADIKSKSSDVAVKLATATATRTRIERQREVYRPVATRGAVLFVATRDMAAVQHMYQTSLDQFLELFGTALRTATPATFPEVRVGNLVQRLTHDVLTYVSSGLFVEHKVAYRLSFLFRALTTALRAPSSLYALLVTPTSGLAAAANSASSLSPDLRKWLNVTAGGRGAATLTPRPNPTDFLSDTEWANLLGVAAAIPALASLPEMLVRHAGVWEEWMQSPAPEALHMGTAEAFITTEGSVGEVWRLFAVRCLRVDRTVPCVYQVFNRLQFFTPMQYLPKGQAPPGLGGGGRRTLGSGAEAAFTAGSIVGRVADIAAFVGVPEVRDDETLLRPSLTIPLLGPDILEEMAVEGNLPDLLQSTPSHVPLLLIVAPGHDPFASLLQIAKRRKLTLTSVGMGEGTGPAATAAINEAVAGGHWVCLQNCHLAVAYLSKLPQVVANAHKLAAGTGGGSSDSGEGFRLLLSALPHPDFPPALLQRARKVTVEPPSGLRSGLMRLFHSTIDQRTLEAVDSDAWRRLVYSLCFLHVACMERRKYGPLAWSISYDFTEGDLQAMLMFLERHMVGRGAGGRGGVARHPGGPVDFPTLRHMLGEVQYGGRITDQWDARTFSALSGRWMSPGTFSSGFTFLPAEPLTPLPEGYTFTIPVGTEIDTYRDALLHMPAWGTPEVYGLHPNADRTHRVGQAEDLLQQVVTLTPTGPGGSGESDPSSGGGYGTAVASRAAAVLADMPPRFDVDAAMAALSLQGGLSVPLNLVMFQEVQQLNIVIDTVSQQLHQVQLAVRGEFPMSDTLAATGVQLERGAVPAWWITAPSGDEISWRATSLSTWCDGLTKRAHELSAYLARGRPTSFWLTGLLNPRAFITAMKQEVCRTQGGASPLFGKGAGRPSQRATASTGENWALDKLELITAVQGVLDPEHISFRMVPGEGVLVHGLTLQGACWSVRGGSLTEAPHGTLWSPLPVLKLTACPPGTARKEGGAGRSGVSGGQFACPCYVYKTRTAERLVFVATLPSGLQRPEHWVLRGVALLCNTDV